MATLPEGLGYVVGVYQLETTDPLEGGVDGILNKAIIDLASRTKWLKDKAGDLETNIDQVADDLAEEILDRADADTVLQNQINTILRYIPKNRGYFNGFDPDGMTVGNTLGKLGDIVSATVTASGSNSSTVRIVMSNAMPSVNYSVKLSMQTLATDINQANNLYSPVYRIINSTTFDVVLREATSSSQNIRMHIEAFDLTNI